VCMAVCVVPYVCDCVSVIERYCLRLLQYGFLRVCVTMYVCDCACVS
jgi:hypothetical protein